MPLGGLFSSRGRGLLSVVQLLEASLWKKRDEGAKAAISNGNRCPFNSKSSVAWQEQLSKAFEGRERERERERRAGNETGLGQPHILFPLRTYRVYIGWSSTAPWVTVPSLAQRAAALRGTFLCLPRKTGQQVSAGKPSHMCLLAPGQGSAGEHKAAALIKFPWSLPNLRGPVGCGRKGVHATAYSFLLPLIPKCGCGPQPPAWYPPPLGFSSSKHWKRISDGLALDRAELIAHIPQEPPQGPHVAGGTTRDEEVHTRPCHLKREREKWKFRGI